MGGHLRGDLDGSIGLHDHGGGAGGVAQPLELDFHQPGLHVREAEPSLRAAECADGCRAQYGDANTSCNLSFKDVISSTIGFPNPLGSPIVFNSPVKLII